ncbi:MAG: hypothetical protein WDA03_06435 [Trueperaceae bacterium]|jgi:hypothetical protein
MSKKAKTPKTAPPEEGPVGTPAPVPNYDAKRVWKSTTQYSSVSFDTHDGEHFDVLVPVKGRPSRERETQAALEYAQALRRVRTLWDSGLDAEWLAKLRENLIRTAAGYVALQLVTIASERFGEEGLIALYGDLESVVAEDRVEAVTEEVINVAAERQARALRNAYEHNQDALDEVIRQIELDAVTAVLLDFEEEHHTALETMSEEEANRLFDEALDKDLGTRRGEYAAQMSEYFAHQALDALEAGSVPLETLLEYLDITPTQGEELALPPLDLARAGLGLLTMQPAQTIDRAARGPSGWLHPPNFFPRFNDPRSPLFVEYRREGATAEALSEGVNRLNPRTADVWRLITARSLEAWPEAQDSPSFVWIDVHELAGAMGYKKHHKGGYKPEHLAEIARAIHALDSFRITLPLGTEIYKPAKAGSKQRATEELTSVRTYKVLHIDAQDEVRNLFGELWEMRYSLKPGEWIKLFPRLYAPLFRALVELPAKAGASTWAKAIGTELVYKYRQNAEKSDGIERLKVRTILDRAVLLEEATQNRNKGRIRTYFEEALDLLKAEGVCAGWEYAPEDSDRLEAVAGARGWFDVWLECRVLITTPDSIASELEATRDTARKARRQQQRRRRLSDTR